LGGDPMDGVARVDGAPSVGAPSANAIPMDVRPPDGTPAPTAHIGGAIMPAPHEAEGARTIESAPGHDPTTRHDGSTPAG
jgi:hypothetical protein